MSKFYLDQLNQFIGWTVENTAQTPATDDPQEQFFGLVLRKGAERKIIWFLGDDEGNCPGSFEVQELQE